MINIVCNIDEKYIEYCGVTLSGLFLHTPDETFSIHIICSSKVPESGKERLKAYCEKHNAQVSFYNVQASLIESFPRREQDHLSVAAYLRLFMSELLPDTIDKVLYIDCDILINGSIKELWETNIDDVSVAAVEERPPFDIQSPFQLGYPAEYSYFNSGVMLINLKKWREKNLVERCKQYIASEYKRIRHHDQDVLNALLYNDKKFISIRWNLMDFFLYLTPDIQFHRTEDLKEAIKAPAIIHFTGSRKPWMHNCDNPYRNLYIRFAKREGWHVIDWKASFHYHLRAILYKLINKKKSIKVSY